MLLGDIIGVGKNKQSYFAKVSSHSSFTLSTALFGKVLTIHFLERLDLKMLTCLKDRPCHRFGVSQADSFSRSYTSSRVQLMQLGPHVGIASTSVGAERQVCI